MSGVSKRWHTWLGYGLLFVVAYSFFLYYQRPRSHLSIATTASTISPTDIAARPVHVRPTHVVGSANGNRVVVTTKSDNGIVTNERRELPAIQPTEVLQPANELETLQQLMNDPDPEVQRTARTIYMQRISGE